MTYPSVRAGLCLLLLSATSLEAAPQQPIGSALVVVNLVTAEFNRDTRTLQSGDNVHQDEMIEVGLDGSSELQLDDETKLALGPGSHLKLDKFVYDPAKTSGSIVLDLVKGSFRFMTGVAQKPTYVIKTPAAAITVRGTIFDVYVENDGASWLLLHEGAVQVCNSRGQCRDLDEPGKLIRIGDDGDVGPPVKWASLPGNDSVPFDDAFPFVAKTPSFDPNPILTREAILLGTAASTPYPPKKTETTTKPERETEATPPKRKKRAERETPYERPYERPQRTKKSKYEKYEKKRRADNDEKVMRGVGAAIGIGIGIGIGKNRGHGGMGGGGHGGYPSRGSGGMRGR